MGLDVSIRVKGPVSYEELEAADKFVKARVFAPPDYEDKWFVHLGENGEEAQFVTLSRYYGPGYERGNWPDIYGYVRLTQAAFPGHEVYYGSDSGYRLGLLVTEEFLQSLWDWYLGPHGNDYHQDWKNIERRYND